MNTISSMNNVGIEIYLLGRLYNSASIEQFRLNISLDGIPTGMFQVFCNNDTDMIINSGECGMIKFNNTGSEAMENYGISFVVVEANQDNSPGNNNFLLNVSFKLGVFETYETKTLQKHGSAPEVMMQVFKGAGYEEPINLIASKQTADTMNWIYVRDDAETMLTDIVSHSFLEGDYVYFAFSTDFCNYVISSINQSKEYYNHQMFAYVIDSKQSTDNSMFYDETSKYTVWLFGNERRLNNAGKNKEDLYPNIVYSSFADGRPDVGMCDASCFGKLLEGSGFRDEGQLQAAFGPGTHSYGRSYMLRDYPLNTGNMYGVAPIMRKRYRASLGKELVINLINNLGPDVGTSVYVYTRDKDSLMCTTGVDNVYADQYIVISKDIIKSNKNSRGEEDGDNEIYCQVHLVSQNLTEGTPEEVIKEYEKIKFPNDTEGGEKI